MPVSLIAAVCRNRAIGRDGRIPWRLPDDLAYFKRITLGHPVLMGRKTWDSIGRPLPGRRNLVLSRDRSFRAPGAEVLSTAEEALAIASRTELFVIGGASLYELFLPLAERLYLTHIDADVPGDAFFPAIDARVWRIASETPGRPDAASPLPHRFVVYERST